jgi:DNA-directed RNA polymerase sigma subunit (sigma70/sigma32)
MAIRLDDYLAKLPAREQEAVAARAGELIREEMTLRALRETRQQSQKQIAERLGVEQAAVSKMERRADMYISTLRDAIRAMGGELDIVARFPDAPPVRINQFHAIASD